MTEKSMTEKYYHFVLLCIIVFLFFLILTAIIHTFLSIGFTLSALIAAGLIVLFYMFIDSRTKPSVDDQNKFWDKYDIIRLEWGLVFVQLSVLVYSAPQILFGVYSSDIFAIALAFYLTGVALLLDGAWPVKQDLEPLRSQYKTITNEFTKISNRQIEILNRLDAVSEKMDSLDHKITQKNFCSKVRFKYR